MQKRRNGQALVEFVLLLPLFIFMIFTVIDFGKILYTKNNLESKMDEVITLYETKKESENIKDLLKLGKEKIELEIKNEQEYINFFLKKKLEILTPGLNLILKNPYEVVSKRVVYNE